jgi:hypothetical protein
MKYFPNNAFIYNVIFKTSCAYIFNAYHIDVQLLIFKNLPSILLDSEQKVRKVSKVGFPLMDILMCKFSKSKSQKKFFCCA